jgi:hypothetical protein
MASRATRSSLPSPGSPGRRNQSTLASTSVISTADEIAPPAISLIFVTFSRASTAGCFESQRMNAVAAKQSAIRRARNGHVCAMTGLQA